MTKSLDLKQEHFAQRPAQRPVLKPRNITGVPGVKGTLPLQPGEIILTEYEKSKLKKHGWKEGDPLPGNISDLMAKAQKEVADDLRTARPFKDHPTFKAPEPIDISELSQEKRSELEGYLQQFKTMAPQIEAAAKTQQDFSTLPPDIQKAIRDAGGGVEVVDSREDPVKELQRKVDEAEGRVEPRAENQSDLDDEDEDQPKKKMESQTGLTSDHSKCPRCNLVLGTKPVEPAVEDKLNYVAAILGDKLFHKEYALFGGKLLLGFRQLATTRADMVFHQVAHEIRVGLLGENTYRQVMLYRMVLSLDYVSVGGQTPVSISDAVDSFLEDPENDTKSTDALPIILNRLQKIETLKSESVWRASNEAFARFNNLLDDLDARADNPDFWNAIGA
jgi:hypothetical protein